MSNALYRTFLVSLTALTVVLVGCVSTIYPKAKLAPPKRLRTQPEVLPPDVTNPYTNKYWTYK